METFKSIIWLGMVELAKLLNLKNFRKKKQDHANDMSFENEIAYD